jgi:hypothetical protein
MTAGRMGWHPFDLCRGTEPLRSPNRDPVAAHDAAPTDPLAFTYNRARTSPARRTADDDGVKDREHVPATGRIAWCGGDTDEDLLVRFLRDGTRRARRRRAQGPGPTEQDKSAVRQAAYDYAEGIFDGAAERVQQALHPAIVNRLVTFMPGGGSFLTPLNAEMLVEAARLGFDKQPAEKRNISFGLLD